MLVEELRRFARGESFDEQPMPGLDSEALDFRAASESFAPFRTLGRRDLETLRLVTQHQRRKAPTVGRMILFGNERERHFPDAWIRAGRFAGADKSRILDRAEIRAIPVRSVEDAIGFVQKHAWHGVSKLRNRVIGRTFHALGLIEQWGSGIQRMTTACRAAGLPAPVFEEIATRFRITIATTRVGPSVVDEGDQAILESLGGGQGLATSEIAATIGPSPRATRTRLARLVGRGLVREIGTGPQDPRRRYFLASLGFLE